MFWIPKVDSLQKTSQESRIRSVKNSLLSWFNGNWNFQLSS
jgi:hypothetical protein